MTTLMALLMIFSLLAFPVGLIVLVVKLIRKKPVRKTLKMLGGTVLVFFVSVALFSTDTDSTGTTAGEPAQEPSAAVEDAAGETDSAEPAAGEADGAEPAADGSEAAEPTAAAGQSGAEDASARDEDAIYLGDDIWLDNITDFSEGRAWVEFSINHLKKGSERSARRAVDAAMGGTLGKIIYGLQNGSMDGTQCAAVIDTHGKIVWQSDVTRETSGYVLSEKSDFRDGLAYCLFNSNDGPVYCIVDGSGNLTYTQAKSDDFQILGAGGGFFLVVKKVSGFEAEGWQIGVIDKNGNAVMPFQEFQTTSPNYQQPLRFDEYGSEFIQCKYMGDGVFELRYQTFFVLLNVKTQKIIYTGENTDREAIDQFLTKFEGGAATVIVGESNNSKLCTLKADGTLSDRLNNAWTRRMLSMSKSMYGSEALYGDGLLFVPYDGNLDGLELGDYYEAYGEEKPNNVPFICHTGVYYGLDGKVAVDLPQYRGKHDFSAWPFQNGHAAVRVVGADGQRYVTAIDKSGNTLFDPIPGFWAAGISDDGKYLTAARRGAVSVFDLTGKELVEVKYTGIYMEEWDEESQFNVRGGVLRAGDFYVNVTDGTVIGLYQEYDREFSLRVN
ncbi:hypothetical protein D7X33_20580 [Butyricicoccus sp. 1XD8-22]|nr:hypothetical protein D7X33_20580 [Butyricicoccus sp. 1XD8-22]